MQRKELFGIGDLSKLNTTNKRTLVNAINEIEDIARNSGGHVVSDSEPANKDLLWIDPSNDDFRDTNKPSIMDEISKILSEHDIRIAKQISNIVKEINNVNIRIDNLYELIGSGGVSVGFIITTIDGFELTTIDGDKIMARR